MSEIPLLLGRDPDGKDVRADLADAYHWLITGRTRSGKSVAVYTILGQLAGRDDVIVAGVDPSGIVFNALGQQLGGNSWRVQTLREASRCLTVLTDLVEMMDARIDDLLALGLDKFDDFSFSRPLVLVVFEEYPGMLEALKGHDQASGAKPGERIAGRCQSAIQRLALEGAKVGFRLVVCSQRGDASILTGILRSQLAVKLTFAQDPDGVAMVHPNLDQSQAWQVAGFEPGQGLVEAPTRPLTMFKGDFLSYTGLRRIARNTNGV